jgi:hypothetical protein
MSDRDEIELINSMVKSYRDKTPRLKLLVFGPGEGNPDVYAKKCYLKRVEIRDSLRNNHTVIFPEEAYCAAKAQGLDLDTITYEKQMMEQTDFSIFIYVPNCPGVDHELSTFSIIPECTRKMLLFYANDCKYSSQWVHDEIVNHTQGGGGQIHTFNQKDLEQCNLKKRIQNSVMNLAAFALLYPYKKYGGTG